jgi:hypothetical protein
VAPKTVDPLAEVEVPRSGSASGSAVCSVASIAMQRAWFGVPLLQGVRGRRDGLSC